MPAPKFAAKTIQCSPRGVLLIIRAEFASEEFRSDYSVRLTKARRETCRRISAKEKRREFPGRRPHKAPEPPVILRLPVPSDLIRSIPRIVPGGNRVLDTERCTIDLFGQGK